MTLSMSKLELTDTVMGVFKKMSEGNPGAIHVMTEVMNRTPTIDPDNFAGGLGPIMFMDTMGVYGSRIWMLYKDVCKESVAHTVAVLRAVQMGLVDEVLVSNAINSSGAGIDVEDITAKVMDALPNFNIQG